MNALQKILAKITDDELRECLLEMKQLDETGVYPPGVFQMLAREIKERINIPLTDANSILTSYVLRTIAYRWAEGKFDNVVTTVQINEIADVIRENNTRLEALRKDLK